MVPAERADVAPERRLVTILFADLSGYTAMCATLDPEDVHDIVRPAMRSLRSVAESFGAVVPGIQGDGFMAVFGAPVAHEDDAERAVRAAFALQDARREINAGHVLALPELHIGVNTGEVVAWAGDGPADVTLTGDPVNMAARLCSLAAPGEICIGERTVELTRGLVDYSEPVSSRVRGIDEPVSVHRAVALRHGMVPGRRTLSLGAPFVGRRPLLRDLDDLLAKAAETGSSQVLAILGDAGYGKSRLALEWTSRADAVVLSAAVSAYDDDPLAPWIHVVPALGELGVTARDVDVVAAAAQTLRRELSAAARERPVVVALDDMHWAHPAAAELIDEIDKNPIEGAVVVLALTRPDARPFTCRTRTLPPLDDDEMRELLRGSLGAPLPTSTENTLMGRSGGNPLFLEECLQLLVEENTLDDVDAIRRIPNSMRQFIAARLDALPAAERVLVQDAAVAGDAVWDAWLVGIDPARDTAQLLASLERRGLLRRAVTTAVAGAAEYTFKHALIRDVAYDSLSRRVRAQRHGSLAEWLSAASVDGSPVVPARLLAHHYGAAWDLVRRDAAAMGSPPCELATATVGHLAAYARELAAAQPSRADAVLTQAIDVVDAAPRCFDPVARAELLVARAEVRVEQQHHQAALDDMTGVEIDEDESHRALLGRARLVRAHALTHLSRIDEAGPVFEEALALLGATGDTTAVARGLRQQAYNLRLGDRAAFLAAMHRAYDACVAAEDIAGQREVAAELAYQLTAEGGATYRKWYGLARAATDLDSDVRGRAMLHRTEAFVAQHLGENRRALELARLAHTDAVAAGVGRVTADALICQLAATSSLGLPDENERLFVETSQLATSLRLRRLQAMALAFSARPRLLARDPAGAAARIAHARELLQQIGASGNRDADLADLAVARDAGEWARGSALARSVVDMLERDGRGLYAVPVRVDLARVVLGADPAASVEIAAEALDAARRHDTPQHGALAAVCLEQAQLLSGQATSQRIGAAPEAAVELDATADENVALHHVRRGAWEEASAGFALAGARWAELGATVWLARALVWQAEALARAGLPDAPEVRAVVARLLADLEAPADLVESFAAQLRAVSG